MRPLAGICMLIVATAGARAERAPDYTPLMRVAISDVTIVGKVTDLDKDLVEATAYPGVKEKTKYTVATVKVETNIRGAKGVTHVKVGFYPASFGTKGSYKLPTLKEGQEVCLFLTKHHEANFYVMAILSPPIDVIDGAKETIDRLKRVAPVFADPLKSLNAEKADDRAAAAWMLAVTYRTLRIGEVPGTPEKIGLDESQAILKGIAESDWSKVDPELQAGQSFLNLGVHIHPKFAKIKPNPGADLSALWQAELKRWLPADGKEFQIEKFVPKK